MRYPYHPGSGFGSGGQDFAISVNAGDYVWSLGSSGAAIQAAINTAVAHKLTEVVVPPLLGGAFWQVPTTILNPGIMIRGDSNGGTSLQKIGGGCCFQAGVVPTLPTSPILFASDAPVNSTTLTLATGKGVNFSAGTLCIILCNTHPNSITPAYNSEFVRVQSVSGDVLTLNGPIIYPYLVSAQAQIMVANLAEGVGYSDLNVRMDPTVIPTNGATWFNNFAFGNFFCHKPIFRNVSARDNPAAGIFFTGCLDASVENYKAYNLGSADNDTDGSSSTGIGGYGYGIEERALNQGLVAKDLHFEYCRHGYTTGAGYVTVWKYGMPTGTLIANGIHINAKQAGWDSHETGKNITFSNLGTVGGMAYGFQLRSNRHRIFNCFASNVLGPAVFMFGNGALPNGAGDECVVDGLDAEFTNLAASTAYNGSVNWVEIGAIQDAGLNNVVRNVRVSRSGGPLLYLGSTALNGSYSNLEGLDINQLSATNKYGAIFTQTAADAPRLNTMFIRDTQGKTIDLVHTTLATQLPQLFNVTGIGHTGATFSTSGSGGTKFAAGGYGPFATSLGYRQTVTLAGNAFDVRTIQGGAFVINPSTGTTDTLTNITSPEEGMSIVLIGSTSNTITITHGTGNIRLKGGTNASLVSLGCISLRYMVGAWLEQYRNF